MNKITENRSRRMTIRFLPTEFQLVESNCQKTTYKNISEYSRNILLGKLPTVRYRNESLDEIFEELITLRKELNAVGNNLNQAVHKINAAEYPDTSLCMKFEEILNKEVRPSIATIMDYVARYSEIWSQNSLVERV